MACNFSKGMCANRSEQEVLSPDKAHKAFVYVRDCGATTGFSSQLSVVDADEDPVKENESGNVLIIGDKSTGREQFPEGGAKAVVSWKGSDTLIVNYDRQITPLKKETEVGGITIIYADL